MNKKILIVQRTLHHYRDKLFQYIRSRGEYDIDVLITEKSSYSSGRAYCFAAKTLFHYKNYNLSFSLNLYRYIKSNYHKYDYIILEGASNITNNIPIIEFLKHRKKAYIIWDAGRRRGSKRTLLRMIAQFPLYHMWRNAAAIIAYSSYAKRYFKSIGVPDERIFICQNTICVSDFDREIESVSEADLFSIKRSVTKDEGPIILYVGAIEPRKRVEDLIKAYIDSKSKIKNVSLILIGDGQDLRRLKAQYNNTEGIHFLGSIIEGVIPYFLLSDLFVLPSEGGLSLNQAMICHLPIIASSADGTEIDLVVEGKNGYIFQEGNVKDLANKILSILEKEELRKSMGVYSRSIIDKSVNERCFYNNLKRCLEFVC